jgi:hypothetical protein
MKRFPTKLALIIIVGCNSQSETEPITSDVTPNRTADKMPPRLVASAVTKETLRVGTETVVQSDSSIGRYQAVFEDDGQTGYFYALDSAKPDNPIVDALHIYNVESVADRDKPSQLHIVWSADGMKAALFINSYPHAIYNFESNSGCCRTGFPPPVFASASHEWDESQMAHFHTNEGS